MQEQNQIPTVPLSPALTANTPPENQPEQPTKPYGRNWKKWILIYLAIGAILYAGIYYFVLSKQISKPYTQPVTKTTASPTPASNAAAADPTADWKTYDEKEFSIKTPRDWWRIQDTYPQAPITFQNFDPKTAPQRGFSPESDKGILKIDILSTETDKKLDEFLSDQDSQKTEAPPSKFLETIQLLINGQPAIKRKYANVFSGYNYVVYAKHPTKPIVLTINFNLDFNNYQDLTDQILSTFKFTVTNSTTNSSSAAQKCATYTKNDIATNACAVCGNGVCEQNEKCTAQNTKDGFPPLAECGPLYCGQDCQ